METFQPVMIGAVNKQYQQKPQTPQPSPGIVLKRSSKIEEEERHSVMIFEMGDFERLLRNKDQRYRVPGLSDEENHEITRVYFGNPFKII